MNKSVWAALAIIPIVVVLGLFYAPYGYIFEPGQIKDLGLGRMSGEFHVKRAPILYRDPVTGKFMPGGDNSRLGGACLVARPADVGVVYPDAPTPDGPKCSSDTQCTIPNPTSRQTGWYGYCDTQQQRCWVRPGPGVPGNPVSAPFCNRSVDLQGYRWPPGKTYPANRAPLNTGSIPGSRTVTWRVLTCQSIDGVCFHRFGRPRTLPRGI